MSSLILPPPRDSAPPGPELQPWDSVPRVGPRRDGPALRALMNDADTRVLGARETFPVLDVAPRRQ